MDGSRGWEADDLDAQEEDRGAGACDNPGTRERMALGGRAQT